MNALALPWARRGRRRDRSGPGGSHSLAHAYNYLGLADLPAMLAASHEAIECYGTTSGATRIVSGNIPSHDELERTIADSLGVQDASTRRSPRW